eukprot:528949_1
MDATMCGDIVNYPINKQLNKNELYIRAIQSWDLHLKYSYHEILGLMMECDLIKILNVNIDVCQIISLFCLESFLMTVDHNLVEMVTSKTYDMHGMDVDYPVENVFTEKQVWCTDDGETCVNILLKLSIKNHLPTDYNYDDGPFIISKFIVKSPKPRHYSSPVDSAILWIFTDKPSHHEITNGKFSYWIDSHHDSIQIDHTQHNRDETKPVAILSNLAGTTQNYTLNKLVIGNYALIKIMASDIADVNIDISYFGIDIARI